jgi:ribosomal protein S18 acetylase RimI-like enzyme
MEGEVLVRPVRESEHAALGELTVAAYRTIPGYAPSAGYEAVLHDVAGRAEAADVLVAVDREGRILGGVAYVPGLGPLAEFDGEDEAGIRMLAVDPGAQGRGVGSRLTRACVASARAAGKARLVLHTTAAMTAAHRVYERLGFVRTPERDLAADGDLELRAYVLDLRG